MVRKELAFIGFALLFVSCMNGGTNSNVKQYKLDNYQVLNEYDFDTIGTIRDDIVYQNKKGNIRYGARRNIYVV